MCQFEIVLTFCVCPIQIGGGGLSAKYNSATKRFYCAALCLFASPARVEKTNLSGLHPNVNKASAFKAEIFRLDTGWLFKLLPPLFSTKMKNGERANQRLSQMKDFMEQQLWLAPWHVFISALKNHPLPRFIPGSMQSNLAILSKVFLNSVTWRSALQSTLFSRHLYHNHKRQISRSAI